MDNSLDIQFYDDIKQIEDCDINMFRSITFSKPKTKVQKYSRVEKWFITFAESSEVKAFYTSFNSNDAYKFAEQLRACITKFNMQDQFSVRLKHKSSNKHDWVDFVGVFKKEPLQYTDIKIGSDVSYCTHGIADSNAVMYCNKLKNLSYVESDNEDGVYDSYLKFCNKNGINKSISKKQVSILIKSLNLKVKDI